uniref:Uncharacterized protein n=1 Tax=Rhizophora mucronata TaxID=61149 RepID=A0A2P2N6Y9_RHIMU
MIHKKLLHCWSHS